MSENPETSQLRRQRPEWRFWFWLGFVALCVGAVDLRLWQIERGRAAQAAWVRQCKRVEAAAEQQFARLRPLIRNIRGKTTLEQIGEIIDMGEPVVRTADKGRRLARWTHRFSGTYLEVELSDGGVSRSRINQLPNVFPAQPTASELAAAAERVRGTLAGWNTGLAPAAWIVLAILCLVWKRRRAVLAELMLAAAILSFVAWLVNPGYSLTLVGILSNDMLFWGTLMLVTGFGLWTWCRMHPRRPGFPHCPHCEYDLTANVSGICPECGNPIADQIRRRLLTVAPSDQ